MFSLMSAGCTGSEETTSGDAVAEGWVQSNSLSTGVFFAMVPDPNDSKVSYAASSTLGLFKTGDTGRTWRPFNQGLPALPIRSLFVDPVDARHLYATLVGGGVFETGDAGQTWRVVDIGQTDVRAVAFNPHASPSFFQVSTTNGSNTLQWGRVPNATEYLLYVCTATPCDSAPPGPDWTRLSLNEDQTTKGEFLHSGLPNDGTRYYYIVKAKVNGVESPPSSKISAVPKPPPPSDGSEVPYPNGLTIVSGDKRNILRWNAVTGGKMSYKVYKKSTPGVGISAGTFDDSDPVTDITYVDSELPNGAPVYYVVTAVEETTQGGTTTFTESTQASSEVSSVPQPVTALFTGTGKAGVIASGPRGESSTAITTGLSLDGSEVSSLVIDQATLDDPHPVLYIGTRDGVYRMDAQRNWRSYKTTDSAGSLPPVLSLALDAADPNLPVLYAGTARGIFRRGFSNADVSDTARPWTFLGHPTLAVTSVTLDPAAAPTVYATTGTSGIFKSTDAGATWSAINQGLTALDIRSLIVHPKEPNLLYAGGVGTVFKSTDGGIHWSPLDFGSFPSFTNLLAISTVRAIVPTPGAGNLIYAGSSFGVFKTADQGAGWAAMNTGLPLDILALVIHPTEPAVLYAAAAQQGVYQSVDGGGSWRAENGSVAEVADALKNITTLILDPADPTRLYAGTAGLDVFQGIVGADGHIVWSSAATDPSNRGINSLVKVSDSGVLFAGTSGQGIFKLPEGASEWAPASSDLSDRNILGLVVHPQNSSVFYAGTSTGAHRSTDGGAQWLPIPDLAGKEIFHIAFDPVDGATLYAVSSEGVYKSFDQGESWTFLGEGILSNVRVLLVDPLDHALLYAGTVSTGVTKLTQ